MATGDQADFVSRLKSLLPLGWFKDSTPILDGVLNGIAWALASVYSLTAYARLQTRIDTATDAFLDLISFDFFGNTLPRKQGETDASFRSRIQAEIFLERATRNGLIKALTLLTGRVPLVFEPARAADTGGLNVPVMGLNVAGYLGSYQMPFQVYCVAYRPLGQGVANIAGLNNPEGGLNTASQAALINPSLAAGITDDDILATINSVRPVNTIVWTSISNGPVVDTTQALLLENSSYLLMENGNRLLLEG